MRKVQLGFVLILVAVSVFALSVQRESLSPFQQWWSSNVSEGSGPHSGMQQKVVAYTLPPDLYAKAHKRSRIYFRYALITFFYGLAVLWLILRCKLAARYRDWAEKVSCRRYVQGLVFAPLLLLTVAILTLPADIYENWLERAYGLSVQGWGSWTWDWTKEQLIEIVIGTIVIRLLYVVIRRSARRWWFYFWLISLPIGLTVVFLQPVIIDPLFHQFEPLQKKNPELTASLEKLVRRSGENIPPERMFWMGAGEKTTELNAYVTGIGASKRIVVWDTTIARMSTPQITFVVGHEMGHYVLHHIPKMLAACALLFFVLFYLGFRCIGWVLARWGTTWGIRSLDDWASLPALMLLLSIFLGAINPLSSVVSRHYEHQADQYGLEVTHGLTPDAGQVAAQSFQILGEVDLSDPDPNPAAVLLFYSHPTIAERVRFALGYDPWARGETGEFVK